MHVSSSIDSQMAYLEQRIFCKRLGHISRDVDDSSDPIDHDRLKPRQIGQG